MRPIACTARARVLGLMLSLACGLAIAAPSHAQGFQQIGNTMAVPLRGYGQFVAANVVRQRNVNFIALTKIADGNWNTQAVVVGVSQRNNFSGGYTPAKTLFVPKSQLGWVKQVNFNKTIITQQADGNYNNQVAEVAVDQGNYATASEGAFRYLFCPSQSLGPLFQFNANIVIITQIAMGNHNNQIALVGVYQGNGGDSTLSVPKGHENKLVQVNTNVTVITQVANGNYNNQVAEVKVGQQNG